MPNRHSAVVAGLLAAGASLHGKTVTDELAYSLHGDNMHYGMPRNAAAPDRIAGGSSSGSASAVAARLVDFALGTDTGGSTRVPASYCGVWGLRTTHALVSKEGLVPLQPSFDTATWFAHAPHTFEQVGKLLLPASDFVPQRVLWLQDACAQADTDVQPALEQVFRWLQTQFRVHARIEIAAPGTLEHWRQTYLVASAYEAWQTHGQWILRTTPVFAPPIAARWQFAASVTPAQALAAGQQRSAIANHVHSLLGNDAIAILPSAVSVAPLRQTGSLEIDDMRARLLRTSCIASLAGLPQVSIPLRSYSGFPVGVSLLGPAGSDLVLIAVASKIEHRLLQN